MRHGCGQGQRSEPTGGRCQIRCSSNAPDQKGNEYGISRSRKLHRADGYNAYPRATRRSRMGFPSTNPSAYVKQTRCRSFRPCIPTALARRYQASGTSQPIPFVKDDNMPAARSTAPRLASEASFSREKLCPADGCRYCSER